jgi:8-oxo-dGTP pyrophosphatase MutT (NUDIX family)
MEHNIVKAVGVWFYSSTTNRYLYLLRNDHKHPGSWGLPGGKIESNESLLVGLERECQEEMGSMPNFTQLVPIEKFTNADSTFEYHTFWCRLESEFVPVLNHEHIGYAWVESGSWPRPLHPGLWNTVNIDTVQQKIAQVESSLQH